MSCKAHGFGWSAASMTSFGDRWRVEGGLHGDVWLARRGAWRGAADGLEPMTVQAALARFDTWFPEGWGVESERARLGAICEALGEGGYHAVGHEIAPLASLKSRLRRALKDGRLVALRVKMRPPAGAVGEEVEEAATEPKPETREDKTWVEIVLMNDDEPSKPVPFKKYRVELPDGATREGMLDEHGRAMIVGIDPGMCRVSFPDLETGHL